MDTELTDEGEFKCRLRDVAQDDDPDNGNEEGDEPDDESEESDEDEGEPDAMDAETAVGTDTADGETGGESGDEHAWSEVCNDKLHMYTQSVFAAWRMAIFSPLPMAARAAARRRARAAARATASACTAEKDDLCVAFLAWQVFAQMAKVEKQALYRE